jgi:stage II sporulation protein D
MSGMPRGKKTDRFKRSRKLEWENTTLSGGRREKMIRLRVLGVAFAAICAYLLFYGCKAESKQRDLGPMRVRIVNGSSSCSIGSKGRVTIRRFSSGRGLFSGTLNDPITVKYSSKGIIAGNKLYKVDGILIKPRSGSELLVNGRTYRGAVSVHRTDRKLTVVNYVDVEDYVKGVMANEMVPSWDEDALKAQAVVARSFAIYHILRYPEGLYNIDSTKIQYKGKDSEHNRTGRAVDSTRGEVLYYNDCLLLPHFFSSCGGHTEYAGNVWQPRFAFPKPVPCPYCRQTRENDWARTLSKSFIERKLRAAGVDIRGIKAVLPERKSTFGGRLTHLSVKHSGNTRIVGINKFRLALGSDVIRSGLMTIENRRGDIVFKGKGWGHGVGMCQYGAKSMAELGSSYEAILSYYYPGTKLKRIKY